MKTFVFVLLAVTCWTVASAEESETILTLSKVMNNLKNLKKDWNRGTDDNTARINSPSINDIKDCCIASALECFRSKVIHLPVKNKRTQKSITKELRKTFIVKSVSSCSQKETEEAQCKPCDSQPMVDRQTFVENFHTLLQKIYVKLLN